jgi:hypothetical protein
MDFEKLPLAHDSNILYMYKHPNAIKHIQSLYDENYTVNPRNIIKPVMPRERIIENKKKELKAKVSVSSFIVKDTNIIDVMFLLHHSYHYQTYQNYQNHQK